MNKGRIIKTVVATSALVVLTSMTVFAESGIKNFKDGGYIYLYGQTERQLKKHMQAQYQKIKILNLH